MKIRSVRKVALLSAIIILVVLVLAERFGSHWIRERILVGASNAGIYPDKVSVSIITRSVTMHDVHWSPAADTLAQAKDSLQGVDFKRLAIQGIRLFPLLRDKRLSIRNIIAEDGSIRIQHRTDSATRVPVKLPLTGLEIESLQLVNTSFTIESDSMTTWSGVADLTLGMISITDMENPLASSSLEVPYMDIKLQHIAMRKVNGFYDLRIASLAFDRHAQTLRCDSLQIIPLYPKVEFARKKGTQSTWATVVLPHIEAEGLDLKAHLDTTFTASRVVISDARINAFRDRRVPLRGNKIMPMPMQWLRTLDLALEIDSILINDMSVVYEHVSEKGTSPGTLRLDNLDAKILRVGNREYNNQPRATTIIASSRIMGKGQIQAEFFLPLSPGAKYRAKGNIKSLPLPSLNPMLENVVFASIEEGQLNQLDFEFSYNNEQSNGTLTIDYDNLKIKTLNKDGESDQLKTLLVNTAIKNERHRTGIIQKERDKRRFIFHYWASSVMDGVRNAVVPAAPEGKKQGKKK